MKDSMGRYVLGFDEMDIQHAYLYGLFDKIDNSTEVTDVVWMRVILDEIERYLNFHFTCEEHIMRLYDAPSFAEHQSDHEWAARRFISFMDDFDEGRLNPAGLRIFLTGWLMEHSELSDSLYVKHIQEKRGILFS